jgi:hypothetical protein
MSTLAFWHIDISHLPIVRVYIYIYMLNRRKQKRDYPNNPQPCFPLGRQATWKWNNAQVVRNALIHAFGGRDAIFRYGWSEKIDDRQLFI